MIIFKPRRFPSPFVKPCLSSSHTIPTLNREVPPPASLLCAPCWPRCHAVAQWIRSAHSTTQAQQKKIRFSFSWINEPISLDMSTTAEQGKAKYHATVGAERGSTGDSFRLTWTAKLCAESAAIQAAPQESETSHVGWRREEVTGQESTWMCHKRRMQLITSVSHYHPPYSYHHSLCCAKHWVKTSSGDRKQRRSDSSAGSGNLWRVWKW